MALETKFGLAATLLAHELRGTGVRERPEEKGHPDQHEQSQPVGNFITGSRWPSAAMAGPCTAACGSAKQQVRVTPRVSARPSNRTADYTLVTPGTLTCIAELGFAPFEYMDESTGEAKGFDIDVANAIAEKMGLTCTFLPNQKFDTLVPTIKQGGKADIAISGITINDERAKEIDFTDPYVDSNQSLVVLATSNDSSSTLNVAGKKIACQAGTTGEEWIQENMPNVTCVPLDDVAAAMTGVQTGLYDGFVIDLPVSSNLIAKSFTDLKVAEKIPTGEQYGIAVSKDNPGLTAAINDALAKIKSDGTMDSLETTWFGSTI